MLGWRRDAMTCASCWKRVTKFGSACRLACSSLIATWRCNCVSSAFQTSAMPPCPRRSCNSYFPSRRTGSVLIAISSFYYCCRDKGRCGADVGALCLSVPACLLDPQGGQAQGPRPSAPPPLVPTIDVTGRSKGCLLYMPGYQTLPVAGWHNGSVLHQASPDLAGRSGPQKPCSPAWLPCPAACDHRCLTTASLASHRVAGYPYVSSRTRCSPR